MRPTVLEEKDKMYDAMGEMIMFETPSTAQRILDENFPGHTVSMTIGDTSYAEIFDGGGEVVLRMSW